MDKKLLNSLVRDISYKHTQRMQLFRGQPLEVQCKVIKRASRYVRKELLLNLTDEEVKLILEQLDLVEATDLLQLLPKKKRDLIVDTLNETLKKDLALLLSFDPDTAAGLMNLDYVLVSDSDSIEDTAEKVRIHEKRTGKVPTILVLKNDQLAGFLPGYKLALAKPKEAIGLYVKKLPSLHYTAKEDEVLRIFKQHPHSKIVVLGERNNILGVIYSDDIIHLLQDEESSSLYDFAGLRNEESIYNSFKTKVKFRYKWLILNLATAFLAAFTVGLFENIIAKEVLLAVYMPIVAGMGGNAGTQTLAVMVRGLGQQELNWQDIFNVLKNEVGAGLINGLINGAIVFAIVMLLNKNLVVAIVLAVAMVVNLLIASSFGTLVPVLMKRLGKDPASSATIFITTATDIFGFFAFLGLAAMLLLR